MSAPANVLPLPRWTLAIHAVQFVLAIVILGFDAYGIHFIPYNALIFSLVTCLLTMGIVIYIVGTTLALHKLYNGYIVGFLHLFMLLFWIVDLGLVANLARLWSGDGYYGYGGYYIIRYWRESTFNIKTYYGVLAAGAFFAAVEFVSWLVSLVFVAIYLNKSRTGASSSTHPPPAYAGSQQNIPLAEQKYNQPEAQPTYAAAQSSQPQGQFAQQPVYNNQQQFPTYPQDPINRGQTVSPVSSVGYAGPPPNHSELSSSQHTGNYSANPNASELGAPEKHYNPNVSELSTK